MGIEKGQYSSTSDLQMHVYVQCHVVNYYHVPIHGLPLIRIPVLQSPSVEVGRGHALFIFSIGACDELHVWFVITGKNYWLMKPNSTIPPFVLSL